MKSAHASLIVFSGLAALTKGEALPAADIPVECATICGPMVELTAMCSPGGKIKRRRLDEPVPIGGGNEAAEDEEAARDDDRLERRTFVTLVPAPKSFPCEMTENAPVMGMESANGSPVLASSLSTTSQPGIQAAGTPTILTRVTPVIVTVPPATTLLPHPPQAPAVPPPAAQISSSQPPQPPQPAKTPPATTGISLGASGPISTTAATTTTMTTMTPLSNASSKPPTSSGGSQMEQNMNGPGRPPATMDPEEKCVCLNRSFDVAQIAGLCASCIMQADDVQNNMHVIMATCNFPPQEYTPARDGEANDLNVVASAPAATIWGQKAGVASGAPRMGSFRVVLGAACLVMGAAMLL